MTQANSTTLPAWRAAGLTTYCMATQPWRDWLAARQAARRQARVMMFFYHRVAETADSPWTIPFSTFRKQIDYLRKHFEVVSLGESLRRIRLGNDTPSVHITFDDGYAENCALALPYLIAKGVPTTYFVSSEHVLADRPFAHDLELGKPVAVNTPQQMIAMADAGIEIGSHTRNHADLGRLTDEAELRDEIVGSKQDLESLLDREVRYFAFPYGTARQLTASALRICREAGYEAIGSAVGGYNFPGDNPFHLQRMHGDCEMSRFYNWATMDPRKMRPQLELPSEAESQSLAATQ